MPNIGHLILDISNGVKALAKRVRHLEATNRRATPGSGGGHIIQDEIVDLAQQPRLNFTGAGVVATDNPGNSRTDVTIDGGGIAAVLEGPGIDVVGGDTVGLGGDTILLYDSGGSPVAEFAATGAGLVAALAAASSGDAVRWDDFAIDISGTGGITIPTGVTLAGAHRERSILIASADIATLITLDTPSVLDNFTVNFTFTGDTFGTVRAIRGSDNAGSSIRRLDVILEITGNASTATAVELDLYSAANEVPTPAEDCFFKCFGQNADPGTYASGHRTGAQLLIVTASRTVVVRDLKGIALNTQDEDGCVGLYLRSIGGSLLIAYDCWGLGSCGSDIANTKGILVQSSELHNCKGEAFGTLDDEDAIGIDFGGSGPNVSYGCVGIANVTSGGAPSESIGIAVGAYALYGCVGIATGDGTVDIYGIVTSNSTVLIGCRGDGADGDIWGGDVSMYACQYDTFVGGGTITYLPGDLASLGLANVFIATQTIDADLYIRNNNEIRFYDNGNYVGFEAPALSADQIWVLPDADGNDGDVMFTDGAGNLKWGANASTRAFTFTSPSGGSGTIYAAGHYRFGATANDFNPSITFGAANAAYGDHIFVVAAAGGGGGTDTVIRITGTSMTDAGVRTAADTEDLTVDDAGAAGAYYETAKKWIGQVTIAKISGPDILCNYGGTKYWDDNNEDFKVEGLEVTWLGGANDANPNLILRHHKASGWTYNAGSTPTPPTPIDSMNSDYVTEIEVINGEEGAWKRTNLSENINGSGSEGLIIEIITTANKAFELGNFLIRVVPQ